MIIYILMVFLCNLQSSLCPSPLKEHTFIYSAAAPVVLDQQVEKNDEAARISGERSSKNGKLQLRMNEPYLLMDDIVA